MSSLIARSNQELFNEIDVSSLEKQIIGYEWGGPEVEGLVLKFYEEAMMEAESIPSSDAVISLAMDHNLTICAEICKARWGEVISSVMNSIYEEYCEEPMVQIDEIIEDILTGSNYSYYYDADNIFYEIEGLENDYIALVCDCQNIIFDDMATLFSLSSNYCGSYCGEPEVVSLIEHL